MNVLVSDILSGSLRTVSYRSEPFQKSWLVAFVEASLPYNYIYHWALDMSD